MYLTNSIVGALAGSIVVSAYGSNGVYSRDGFSLKSLAPRSEGMRLIARTTDKRKQPDSSRQPAQRPNPGNPAPQAGGESASPYRNVSPRPSPGQDTPMGSSSSGSTIASTGTQNDADTYHNQRTPSKARVPFVVVGPATFDAKGKGVRERNKFVEPGRTVAHTLSGGRSKKPRVEIRPQGSGQGYVMPNGPNMAEASVRAEHLTAMIGETGPGGAHASIPPGEPAHWKSETGERRRHAVHAVGTGEAVVKGSAM